MQNLKTVETPSQFNHLLQFGLLTQSSEALHQQTKPVVLPSAQKSKFSKRDYNKAYYQQRKLKKTTESDLAVSSPRKFSNFRTTKVLELVILGLLACFMTIALVKEAAGFYLAEQDGPLYAYLKAGIIEAIAIIFSFARSNNQILKWIQRVTTLMLCGFTLYLMSGSAIKTASKDTMKVEALRQNLQQLESGFKQKEQLQKEYFRGKYITMARRYDKILDQTREKLNATRQELCNTQAPAVISQNLRIVIIFRVLLVIANLVCIHRIVELATSKMEKGDEKRKKHV